MNKKAWFTAAMALVLVACGGTTGFSDSQITSEPTSGTSQPSGDIGDTIIFRYKRLDNNYENWNMWIWASGFDGMRYDFEQTDDYGSYLTIDLADYPDTYLFGFIVRKSLPNDEWSAKDTSADRFINILEWEPNSEGIYNVFLLTGDANIYTDTNGSIYNGIRNAYFSSKTRAVIATTAPAYLIEVLADDDVIVSYSSIDINNQVQVFVTIPTEVTIDYRKSYRVRVSFEENDPRPRIALILMHRLFSDPAFSAEYDYTGTLGLMYSETESTFKVWSPTAKAMALRIYDNGTPEFIDGNRGDDSYVSHAMEIGDKGVWSKTLTGDLEGKFYTYYVTNPIASYEVVDPYAFATGVNGRRAWIGDLSQTNPDGWETVNTTNKWESNTDAMIYELHVRDLTMDSTWTGNEDHRGKYLGLIEEGTTYTANGRTVKTGFDHIKELGVNAVHLLPVFDHNNDETKDEFNWGYNPLNYNVIEGQYSSDPFDPLVRVREFKQMIQGFDQAGIKTIMDVVYNHLGDAQGSNFNRLVPGYYYRYDDFTGNFSNGSGVGNDTASERFMFRKFMVDSTDFLAREYKLGGFRFDLMGLHDLPSMKAVRDNLITLDQDPATEGVQNDIIIYGEGWAMGGTKTYGSPVMANYNNITNADFAGIGHFSDDMRDAVKGSVFSATSTGWIQSGTSGSTLKGTFKGKLKASLDPQRAVQYVASHDNYALFDKLLLSGVPEEKLPRVNVQASAIPMFSQGIFFMHAGDELMREKINADGSRNHNSYNAPDSVNAIKWNRKTEFFTEFSKYQDMLALRQESQLFRIPAANIIAAVYSDLTAFGGHTFASSTLGYKIIRPSAYTTEPFAEVIVLHNGNNTGITVDGSGYELLFHSYGDVTISASMAIAGNTTIVLGKRA
jgi:pullulanase